MDGPLDNLRFFQKQTSLSLKKISHGKLDNVEGILLPLIKKSKQNKKI